MSELRANLRSEFHDEEYRHTYADESLNTHVATQIKVLWLKSGFAALGFFGFFFSRFGAFLFPMPE